MFYSQRPAPAAPPPLPGTYQYFAEIDFLSKTHLFGGVSHADPRYAPKDPLEIEETRRTLKGLLQSYVAQMEELSVETWLAHGALLGWYWNQKLLPWDTDLDVQVTSKSLETLAAQNMSEHVYHSTATEATRTYLLDINPHSSIISTKDVANKIDARWIDTTNGKFIDITAVHLEKPSNAGPNWNAAEDSILFCKDGHRYHQRDVYPLQQSILDGTQAKVPAQSKKILEEEYGKKALMNERFHWYHFDRVSKTWEPD